MGNIEQWRSIVENRRFVNFFGTPESTSSAAVKGSEYDMPSEKGFGIMHLKTAPSGFPRDYEFVQYLRMKDFCCWKQVPDTFFEGDHWLGEMVKVFKVAKPMMDFVNAVIDDYE